MATDPDEAARTDFMVGKIQALLAFSLAVANSHPNPPLLLDRFRQAEQIALARLETTIALDELVEGYQDMVKRISAVLEAASARYRAP
jgi:hypothetical protein